MPLTNCAGVRHFPDAAADEDLGSIFVLRSLCVCLNRIAAGSNLPLLLVSLFVGTARVGFFPSIVVLTFPRLPSIRMRYSLSSI